MNDPLDRLRTALADRYRIERQLGQGGMVAGRWWPTSSWKGCGSYREGGT